MKSILKKILPKKLEEVMILIKQKTIDKHRKIRFAKKIQDRHQYLLQKVRVKAVVRVVFLVIHKSIWKVDPIFKKMLEDSAFDPVILVCPYMVRGEGVNQEEMDEVNDYFKAKNYPVVNSYNKAEGRWVLIEEMKPDLVWFTNPHKITRSEYFEKAYENYLSCYVPYYFMATDHVGSDQAEYNTFFWVSLWIVFLPHETAENKFLENSENKGKNVFVFGYPACENLINSSGELNRAWKKQTKNKKKIIFAPHHTIEGGSNSISSFLVVAELMVELSQLFKDKVQWSFKPHPILKSKLYRHKDWGVDKTDNYYNIWSQSDNTQLDEADYEILFLESDAIVHDSSSFIVEYLFTGKPCMFLMLEGNAFKLVNEFGRKALSCYKIAHDNNDIKSFVVDVINDNSPIDFCGSWFKEYLEKYYINTTPSDNIIEEIKSSVEVTI